MQSDLKLTYKSLSGSAVLQCYMHNGQWVLSQGGLSALALLRVKQKGLQLLGLCGSKVTRTLLQLQVLCVPDFSILSFRVKPRKSTLMQAAA